MTLQESCHGNSYLPQQLELVFLLALWLGRGCHLLLHLHSELRPNQRESSSSSFSSLSGQWGSETASIIINLIFPLF